MRLPFLYHFIKLSKIWTILLSVVSNCIVFSVRVNIVGSWCLWSFSSLRVALICLLWKMYRLSRKFFRDSLLQSIKKMWTITLWTEDKILFHCNDWTQCLHKHFLIVCVDWKTSYFKTRINTGTSVIIGCKIKKGKYFLMYMCVYVCAWVCVEGTTKTSLGF